MSEWKFLEAFVRTMLLAFLFRKMSEKSNSKSLNFHSFDLVGRERRTKFDAVKHQEKSFVKSDVESKKKVREGISLFIELSPFY